jgi:hypothetical protein
LCRCTLKLPIPPALQQLPGWTTTITRRIIRLELCVKSASIWGEVYCDKDTFFLWWNFMYIRCWSETGCCTERGGWRKRNLWSNSLGDLTINNRKGEKNEEELEKFNLREDVVPDPNSDKSIFPLQTPSLCM